MPKCIIQKIVLPLYQTKAKEWQAKHSKYHTAKSVEIILEIENRD